MRSRIILALTALLVGFQSASATEIGLDTVLVINPSPIFGDAFDNNNLDIPPWFIVSGSPGPESGETLAMHEGDTIFTSLVTNREVSLTAFSNMLLTDFPAGSFVSMILFGQGDESVSVGITPGAAFLFDETGAILASTALPSLSEAELKLILIPHGPGLLGITASVNDITFTDALKVDFGAVTGLAINVVPEPATLGLLGLGCLIMRVHRRLFRGRQ